MLFDPDRDGTVTEETDIHLVVLIFRKGFFYIIEFFLYISTLLVLLSAVQLAQIDDVI